MTHSPTHLTRPRALERRTVSALTHVYVIDGAFGVRRHGRETHAGRLYRMLAGSGPRPAQTVGYHPGALGGAGALRAASGLLVNDAIRDGYATLSSRYRPGDRLFLFGDGRGGYAARSLAGLIDRIGLLRPEHAAHEMVAKAFALYNGERPARMLDRFRARHCLRVEIEMIGVWEPTLALGLPAPLLARSAIAAIDLHDREVGHQVKTACQALALDEDRLAHAPLYWQRPPGWAGRLDQMWFPGGHEDVCGDLGGFEEARPLANLSFRWMLDRAEAMGLDLPVGWRQTAPIDHHAPMRGARRGFDRLFLRRARRLVPEGDGHLLHPSVFERASGSERYRPRARFAADERAEAGAAEAAE